MPCQEFKDATLECYTRNPQVMADSDGRTRLIWDLQLGTTFVYNLARRARIVFCGGFALVEHKQQHMDAHPTSS